MCSYVLLRNSTFIYIFVPSQTVKKKKKNVAGSDASNHIVLFQQQAVAVQLSSAQ